MTLDQAIRKNPFNVEKGNLAAYCRYLRYNVDGLYEKSNKYVQRLFIKYIFDEIAKKERSIMADYVELVIKIYKNTYDRITSRFADEDDIVLFENLLKNGTLLPKGHGDLIDRDDLLADAYHIDDWAGNEVDLVDVKTVEMAGAIIEADKTESE